MKIYVSQRVIHTGVLFDAVDTRAVYISRHKVAVSLCEDKSEL